MVDTIVIRIHNLEKNKNLVQYLHKKGISGVEQKRKDLEDGFDVKKNVQFVNFAIDYQTGNTFSTAYRNHIPSSFHDVAYSIHFARDFMEFNFSLPKYFFGNNVMQLVPHYYDNYVARYRQEKYYNLSDYHFIYFAAAINFFMVQEFGELVPDKKDIEIFQIDLAFNYVFRSVAELQAYLNYMYMVKRKHAKKNKKHKNFYEESIYYPGKANTVKIYHKGPEFTANGFNRFKKLFSTESATGLQDFANRVLRYEVSYRSDGLARVWWKRVENNMFDRSCAPKSWKRIKMLFNSYQTKGYFNFQGVRYGTVDGSVKVIPNNIKQIVKKGRVLDRSIDFFMDSDEKFSDIDSFSHKVVFDLGMFRALVNDFVEIVKPFYLHKVGDLEYVGNSVGYLNYESQKVLKEIKGLRMSMVKSLAAMLKIYSWHEIESQVGLSSRQLYRYKVFFNSIGYGDVNTTESVIADIDHTFRTYYDSLFPYWGSVAGRKSFPFKV